MEHNKGLPMRTFSVVTTFNAKGLKKYGQRMIDSFIQNWPEEIKLHIYAEDCNPRIPDHNRIVLYDYHTSVPELVAFKNKWKDVPKANGTPPPNIKSRRKDWHKEFKWDAIRFSHKVYSIFDCAKKCDTDVLFWMDADMYCHSPISLAQIDSLVPTDADLCYVGRERKWAECGLYSINLKSHDGKKFLEEFQRYYDDAENGIFKLDEWHDSFVFQHIINRMPLNKLNWAEGLIKGEGHPLINSVWGAYLDHLKGGRKNEGKSRHTDLLKPRAEAYWRT